MKGFWVKLFYIKLLKNQWSSILQKCTHRAVTYKYRRCHRWAESQDGCLELPAPRSHHTATIPGLWKAGQAQHHSRCPGRRAPVRSTQGLQPGETALGLQPPSPAFPIHFRLQRPHPMHKLHPQQILNTHLLEVNLSSGKKLPDGDIGCTKSRSFPPGAETWNASKWIPFCP